MVLNKDKVGKIVTIFFCLYIILSSYSFIRSLSIGDVIMLFLAIVTLIFTKKINNVRGLLFFWIYIAFQTSVLLVLSKPYAALLPTMNKFIMLSIVYFTLFVIVDVINPHILYKVYWIISALAITCVVIQAVEVWILKSPMTIMIPFYEHTMKDQSILLASRRPSAFFLEPQHLCSFLLPLLLIEMKKQNYIRAGVLTFTILLSTSTQGVVCAAVLWGILLMFDKQRKLKSKIVKLVLIISFVFAFIYTDLFIGAVDKIQSGTFDNNIRIFRAFDVFRAMPVEDKIVGIGMKNVNNYLAYSHVCNRWLMSELSPAHNFISSLIGNFIEFGLIGGIAYVVMLIKMFRKANITGRIFVVLIILSALSATITYNAWMMFYWVLFYVISDEQKFEMLRWKKT